MSGTPITVVGRVGQVDLKFLANGKAVLNGSVAVNRRKFNRDTQQWEDIGTDWHKFNLWEKKAEAAAEAVVKGALVIVVGELESRDFEKDGAKRTAWEIRAQEVGVIASVSSGGGGFQKSAGSASEPDPWATTSGPSHPISDQPPF